MHVCTIRCTKTLTKHHIAPSDYIPGTQAPVNVHVPCAVHVFVTEPMYLSALHATVHAVPSTALSTQDPVETPVISPAIYV